MDDAADALKRFPAYADVRRIDEDAGNVAKSSERMLRELYAAYNRRDAETLLAGLSPDVDWPDDERRLRGRQQVLAYWLDQWSRIQTHDEVTGVTRLVDGRWAASVDQVVRGLDGTVLATSRFEHRHRIEDGLIRRMDIHPLQTAAPRSIGVSHERTTIITRDGECPAHVFTPAGGRGGPAIVFFMDAGGIRPAVFEMAERLAAAGYVVLVPDLFYRYGPYGPFDPREVLKGDFRAILGPLMATTGNAQAAEDTGAFLSFLDTRADVQGTKVGAVGFCMGGGMAIAAASTWPDRFAAVASFHGGNLATDAPDSPHRLAPKLEAELYIAAASSDHSYPPEMAERFERALGEAQVRYTSEIYPAAHGWMKPDFPVYDEAAAERGWRNMVAFLDRTLKRR